MAVLGGVILQLLTTRLMGGVTAALCSAVPFGCDGRSLLAQAATVSVMLAASRKDRVFTEYSLARIIHQPAKSTGEVDFVVQMSDNSTVSRWMRLLNLSCQVVLTPSTSVG
jgi:hypothetical protein